MNAVKGGFIKEIIRNRVLYLMMGPALLLILLFNYLPMGGLVIAFKDYKFDQGILGSKWIGFKNFEFFMTSEYITRITYNTLSLNFLFIVTGTASALFFALLLNEIRSRSMVKIVQSTMLLPYFISWVVAGYFAFALLNADAGLINSILKRFGAESIDWYSQPQYWPFILVLTNIWKNVGYAVVIYLAAMAGINQEYYEAAHIDGASKLQAVFKITIPLIMPIITVLTLMSIGRIFYADFGLFYNVTKDSGLLYSTTDVIDTYVFRALRNQGDVGMSSAVSFYQSIVGFILVLSSNLIVRKYNPDNALF